MPLPINIPALLSAATNIGKEVDTPLAVSVFIDDSAPGDVIGHVRAAFASAHENTRVTISYLGDGMPVPYEADDIAVIVAGFSDRIGQQAEYLRSQGIPVMVVTTMPNLVGDLACAFGHPIPDGDIVAPKRAKKSVDVGGGDGDGAGDGAGGGGRGADGAGGGGAGEESSQLSDEVIFLDDDTTESLNRRMGEWIIAAQRGKRLAFAAAFPFVRRPLSLESVRMTAIENAAVGLILFLRGADMPLMTLNQAKMVLQIAAVYGKPLKLARVREIVVVVAGAFLFRRITRALVGFIPVLGWAIRAGVGFAGTEVMGRAAIEYFDAGGDIVGLAQVIQSARDGVAGTASSVAHSTVGTRIADAAKSAAQGVLNSARQNA